MSPPPLPTVAMTGATGFVGSHLLDRLVATGHPVRALTRRPQPPRPGVTWIGGALDDQAALALLMEGAGVVIHVAGVVNAPDRAGFAAGNIDGTRNVVAAAINAGRIGTFLHISSLAAREPGLSDYGWSKAESERLLSPFAGRTIVVRPPAIYGPGDLELLELFRAVRHRIVPLPPHGTMSVIHVDDLAELLVRLIHAGDARVYEPDDGADDWTNRSFALAVAAALGKRVVPLPLPAWALMTAARLDRRWRGERAKLTPDRARYFCHRDWTAHRRPPPGLWEPSIPTREGLATTAAWYRAQGLL